MSTEQFTIYPLRATNGGPLVVFFISYPVNYDRVLPYYCPLQATHELRHAATVWLRISSISIDHDFAALFYFIAVTHPAFLTVKLTCNRLKEGNVSACRSNRTNTRWVNLWIRIRIRKRCTNLGNPKRQVANAKLILGSFGIRYVCTTIFYTASWEWSCLPWLERVLLHTGSWEDKGRRWHEGGST